MGMAGPHPAAKPEIRFSPVPAPVLESVIAPSRVLFKAIPRLKPGRALKILLFLCGRKFFYSDIFFKYHSN